MDNKIRRRLHETDDFIKHRRCCLGKAILTATTFNLAIVNILTYQRYHTSGFHLGEYDSRHYKIVVIFDFVGNRIAPNRIDSESQDYGNAKPLAGVLWLVIMVIDQLQ